MAAHLWNGSAWEEVKNPYAEQGGSMIKPSKIHAYGYGSQGWGWYVVWPDDGGTAPPPTNPGGTYTLYPHTQTISGSPGGLSWARFNIGSYAGKITAAYAVINWHSHNGSMPSRILGNGSGTYYRSISYDTSYAYRTISHSLGSTAVSQLNSGSATGYTVDPDTSNTPSLWIGSLKLKLTVTG